MTGTRKRRLIPHIEPELARKLANIGFAKPGLG